MVPDELSFTTLCVREYHDTRDYSCDFSNIPRPQYSLAVLLHGSAEIETEGRTFLFGTSEMLFTPLGSRYRSHWHCDEDGVVSFLSVHFVFERTPADLCGKHFPVQTLDMPTGAKERLRALEEALAAPQSVLPAAALILGLLSDTLTGACALPLSADTKRIRPALDRLCDAPWENVSVSELASLCHVSVPRFFTLFRNATGKSPIAYKNERLLSEAAARLTASPDCSVAQIAESLGFCSPDYFSRLFKRRFSLCPAQYRRAHIL